jgi:hypothetical protein
MSCNQLLDSNEFEDNCTDIEYDIIVAFLKGNFHNKEILIFLSKEKYIKYSTIGYTMKKLLKKFSVTTRSELFRKLLEEEIAYFILNTNNSLLKPPLQT